MLAFFKSKSCSYDIEDLDEKIDNMSRSLNKAGDDKYISDKLDELKKELKSIDGTLAGLLPSKYQAGAGRSEHRSIDRRAGDDLVASMRNRSGETRSYGAAQSSSAFSRPKTLTERYNDFVNNGGMKPNELIGMKITTAGAQPYIDRSSNTNSIEFFVNTRADGSMEVYPPKKCISKAGLSYLHRDLFTSSATGVPSVEQPAVVKQLTADGRLSVVQQGRITY
jgi:hypothetical protein